MRLGHHPGLFLPLSMLLPPSFHEPPNVGDGTIKASEPRGQSSESSIGGRRCRRCGGSLGRLSRGLSRGLLGRAGGRLSRRLIGRCSSGLSRGLSGRLSRRLLSGLSGGLLGGLGGGSRARGTYTLGITTTRCTMYNKGRRSH